MTNKIVYRGALALVVMFVATSAVFAQEDPPEYTEWYVGGAVGETLFGWDKIPNSFGLYGAYFFNQKYGAGLAVRKWTDSRKEFVLAPTFFAHWGRNNSKWFFPTKIGVGFDKITYSATNFVTELAFYASAGIAYRPSKLISFGINVDFASSVEYIDESVDYLGFNIGISFHF